MTMLHYIIINNEKIDIIAKYEFHQMKLKFPYYSKNFTIKEELNFEKNSIWKKKQKFIIYLRIFIHTKNKQYK